MKKLPNTRRKTPLSSVPKVWLGLLKCSLQALPLIAICLARPAYADQERSCGTPARLLVTLPDQYESVVSQQAGVVCGFRHKTAGFPTLTVVMEPALSAQRALEIARYVTESYRAVGLLDAQVKSASVSKGSDSATGRLVVGYTAEHTAMEAQLLIILLHDRTYTATLQYRADVPVEEKKELQRVLDSVRLVGEPPVATQPDQDRHSLTLVLALAGLCLVALVLCGVLKKRKA